MTFAANALAVLASISYGAADFLGGLATKRGSRGSWRKSQRFTR